MKCTKCGLSGTIAIPEPNRAGRVLAAARNRCLSTSGSSIDSAHYPETPTKKIVSATITAVETEVKVDEDALTELGIPETFAAGQDEPEDEEAILAAAADATLEEKGRRCRHRRTVSS